MKKGVVGEFFERNTALQVKSVSNNSIQFFIRTIHFSLLQRNFKEEVT